MSRYDKYLSPAPVAAPTGDMIVKRAPTPAAPTAFQVEDQNMQREKFNWDREQAKTQAAEANAKNGGAAYSQSALDAFDRAINSIDSIKKHPGMRAAIGSGFDPAAFGSYNPFTAAGRAGKPMAGTAAAGFIARLGALKAQVFLPMVQSMKGMGALSNAEGEKLTAAIGAMDDSMPEDDFLKSVDEVKADLIKYRDRGRNPKAAAPQGNKRLRYNPATGELE